jgi:hypothetical protein
MTGRPRVRGHRIVGPISTPDPERHWAATTIAIVATIVSIVMSIAAAAVQYMQQQAAAEAAAKNQDAMMKAQDAAIAQNAALANRAYMDETKALQERQRQSEEQAIVREQGVSVEAAKARSTALTAAGESGVSGMSVNMLMDDFTRQEVDYRFQSQTQVGYERDQTQRELENAQLRAEGRTVTMKPYQAQPVQYPSLLGAGLRVGAEVGGKVVGAYSGTPKVPAYSDTSSGLGSSYYKAGGGQYM